MKAILFAFLMIGVSHDACFAESAAVRCSQVVLSQVALTNVSVAEAVAYLNSCLVLTGTNTPHIRLDLDLPVIRRADELESDARASAVVHGYTATLKTRLQSRQFAFQTKSVTLTAVTISCSDFLQVVGNHTGLNLRYQDDTAVLSVFPEVLLLKRYELTSELAAAFRKEPVAEFILALGGSSDITQYYGEFHGKSFYLVAPGDFHKTFARRIDAESRSNRKE
jgi:hypothetical protein